MKTYVSYCGIIGASEEDFTKVSSAVLSMIIDVLIVSATFYGDSTNSHLSGKVNLTDAQVQHIKKCLRTDRGIEVSTDAIYVESLNTQYIEVKVEFSTFNDLDKYGSEIDVSGVYIEDENTIELSIPYPSKLLELLHRNNNFIDSIKGTIKGVLRHEMAHSVQNIYPSYKDAYKKTYSKYKIPIDMRLSLRSAWRKYFKDISVINDDHAMRKKKFLLYVMKSIEVGPWIYTELERFRQLIKRKGISGNELLNAKKHFLSINEPKLSISQLIDLMKTEPDDYDDYEYDRDTSIVNQFPLKNKSLFFLALKTLKPGEYNHNVKLFESAMNTGRYL